MRSSAARCSISAHSSARDLGVEARRRLVEEQDTGPMQQSQRDVQTSLHAAGIRLGRPVGGGRQPEALQRLAHPPLQVAPGDPVELALEDEVLPPGRLRIDAALLSHHPDEMARPRRVGDHVDAADASAAAVRA